MKWKWPILIIVLVLVVALFFIRTYPRPPLVSFNYFVDTLEHIEDALSSAGMDLENYPAGDFALEDVVANLELTDRYLATFESDLEPAMLSSIPHIQFAFHDRYENPIRIWISDDSFRIYSTGEDEVSDSGGRDADDIWTGEPEKAVRHTHESYFDAWHEANERNLWAHLIEQLMNVVR